MNKTNKNKEETCTQKERDAKYGQGWRWNTRNCTSLKLTADVKRCKKDKLKRCVLKQNKNLSQEKAKLKCKELMKSKKRKSSKKEKLQ